MWTFENPPLGYLKEEYGFEPSAEWLDALRLASLRFGGGCSASFVSPKGLIMTNHHCVRGNVAEASPKGQDWVKDGFYATQLEDEVVLKGLTVQQLVGTEDITSAMNAGIAEGDDDAAAQKKRAANQKKIEAEARERYSRQEARGGQAAPGRRLPALRLQDLQRHQAGVRAAPADRALRRRSDNFTYPRYSIDFGFCRAYEDGEPADTSAHYFRWSTTGPKKDELVFVTGNPGTTDRLKTTAQMEYMRDAQYPIVRQLIDSRLEIMRDIAKQSSEQEQEMRTQILMFENAQKAYKGYHEGLLNRQLMAQKAAAEAEFKGKVTSSDELRPSIRGRLDPARGALRAPGGLRSAPALPQHRRQQAPHPRAAAGARRAGGRPDA